MPPINKAMSVCISIRITQTNAKIKREELHGQQNLETAAYEIGCNVRDVIRKNGRTIPEDLPAEVHIKNIKSDLNKTSKAFGKEDKKKIEKK